MFYLKKLLLLKLSITISSAFFLMGCASLLTRDQQEISVKVTCKGNLFQAYCTARNTKGIWDFETPQTKLIFRDSTPLEIICYGPSVGNYGVRQYPGLNPLVAGNFLAGGALGIAIDASKNSLWIYPSVIEIENKFCKNFIK